MRVVERGCTYHEVVFFRCRALHTLPRAATFKAAAPHTRGAYADSLRWAFARRMAGRTACAARSIRAVSDACRSSGDATISRYRFPFGFSSFLRATCVRRLGAVPRFVRVRTHRSVALRTLVLTAFEAHGVSVA
jgi:hypothetical protein